MKIINSIVFPGENMGTQSLSAIDKLRRIKISWQTFVGINESLEIRSKKIHISHEN